MRRRSPCGPLEALVEHVEAGIEHIPRDVQRRDVAHRRIATREQDEAVLVRILLNRIAAGSTAAPIGRPPPSDLAIVKMSGTASECSIAHIFPVRPSPDWTSSSISRRPWSLAIFAIRSIHPGGGTI